ncbi:hypothetical protein AOLI_G00069250 [Acnodon oligacanthus]
MGELLYDGLISAVSVYHGFLGFEESTPLIRRQESRVGVDSREPGVLPHQLLTQINPNLIQRPHKAPTVVTSRPHYIKMPALGFISEPQTHFHCRFTTACRHKEATKKWRAEELDMRRNGQNGQTDDTMTQQDKISTSAYLQRQSIISNENENEDVSKKPKSISRRVRRSTLSQVAAPVHPKPESLLDIMIKSVPD